MEVLRGIDLEVESGELLALLGPSGSGKSTLLRILAGFESCDGGGLFLSGDEFTHRNPQKRGFGMVFQSYALFPHLSIFDNVAFGLTHLEKDLQAERVESMLELVQLQGLGDRGIDQISGGQQQRVALARALAPRPRLLLLDEPLSNLDPSLRDHTRRQLMEIVRAVGTTTILVTHEQEEAFELGDRVAVLEQGVIEQVGTPTDLYRNPRSSFVAGFIGRSNRLACHVERRGEGPEEAWVARVCGWQGAVSLADSQVLGEASPEQDRSDCLWIRPESLSLKLTRNASNGLPESEPGSEESGGLPSVAGTVKGSRLVGPYALIAVAINAPEGSDGSDREHAQVTRGHQDSSTGEVEVAHPDPLEPGVSVRVQLASAAHVRLLPLEA